MDVQQKQLHVPTLDEVATVLQLGLAENFSSVDVNVVDCPDLTQSPFSLAAPGLGGSARVADVGGVPNLIPLVDRTKKYNLEDVAKQVALPPSGFVCGAGAGPFMDVGVNSEMMANMAVSPSGGVVNKTYISKVNTNDGSCILEKSPSTNFGLMGNMYCSEGKSGKVLEVKASQRKGEENYMECIRKTLTKHYQEKPVALGGTFLIDNGKANIHIMPDFSCTPLKSEAEVNNWLRFYEMSSPLVCLGYLISADPDLDLRVEHFHCFSDHGEGGHYHYDITPDDVIYRGYFNVAELIFRIDRPKVTHKIGRPE